MADPCYTGMASAGALDSVGCLFCKLFRTDTLDATERFCPGHKYHLSEIEYKEMVFMRDTTNGKR